MYNSVYHLTHNSIYYLVFYLIYHLIHINMLFNIFNMSNFDSQQTHVMPVTLSRGYEGILTKCFKQINKDPNRDINVS